MNWRQLKDFCNELTEEQLEKKVVIWREDEAISEIEPTLLVEDYYANEDVLDDKCAKELEVLDIIKNNPEDYPNGLGDFKRVYHKGHPMLWENF